MKTRVLCLLITLLSSVAVYGQCPQRLFLTYSTQSDIDTFATNYPNCAVLSQLTLNHSSVDPITDLSGLSSLDTLTWGLAINGLTSLEHLDGLSGLTQVGNLTIEDCDALTSLAGMSQLMQVNGRVEIVNNPLLADLAAFSNIDSVQSGMSISDLPNLTSLSDLAALEYIGGDFIVSDCHALSTVGDFDNLDKIGGELFIHDNDALTSVGPFARLSTIEDALIINYNEQLLTIDGFNNLTSIKRETVEIEYNDLLESLTGFNALETTGDDLLIAGQGLQEIGGFNSLLSTAINFIGFPALERITGFESLQHSRFLLIRNNPNLIEIPDFQSLDSVTISLVVKECEALPEVSGFPALRVVNDAMSISSNGSLQSLSDFPSLSIAGPLKMSSNPSLQAITGFAALSHTNGLEIRDNEQLSSVPDFGNITSIAGSFRLANNAVLNNCPKLDRLESASAFVVLDNDLLQAEEIAPELDSVSSLFWFSECAALTSLSGFNKLRTVGAFTISDNPVLQSISAFNNLVDADSYFTIRDNTQLATIDGFRALRHSVKCEILRNGISNINSFTSFQSGNLTIDGNPQLVSIDGFESMTDGNVTIQANDVLVEIPSFESLEQSINLTIRDNASLAEFDAFRNLISLRNIIVRDNDQLKTFDGFDNLDNAYEIYLSGESITSIPDFNALRSLGNEPEEFNFTSYTGLYLKDLGALETISGFNSLDTLKGWLEIVDNPRLERVEGFDNLTYVFRNLIFYNNAELREVQALKNLEAIGSNYMVRLNGKLKSLPPTTKLREIRGEYTAGTYGSGSLGIEGDSISSLFGLQSLTRLKGTLNIQNTNIASLRGLENIDPSLTTLPSIRDNPRLSNCAVAFLCELIEQSTFCSSVYDNAAGCNSCEEISCLNNDIQGVVYYDFNENGSLDTGELPLQNVRIGIRPDDVELIPRNDGRYIYNCVPGLSYKVEPLLGTDWSVTTDSAAFTFVFDSADIANRDLDFGLVRSDDTHLGVIGLTSGPTRCNTEVAFYLNYGNAGTYEESGEVIVELDDRVEFIDATPYPSSIDNNRLTWDFEAFKPYQEADVMIMLAMPDETFTGSLLQMAARMQTSTEVLAEFVYSPTVICSYDPNDKLVMPADSTENNVIDQEQKLTYTIRFQNEGNAEAIDVSIRDTIDTNLDMTTLEVVASSFPVQTSIVDRAVQFDFDDIWLVSASLDSLASQGYVTYSISPYPDLEPGLLINNEAFIYFDFNAPIRTNTAVSQIRMLTTTDDIGVASIRLYPNPADDAITIDVPADNYVVTVYSLHGQPMYQGQDRHINVKAWPSGMYYARVTTVDGLDAVLSFVVAQ